MSGDDIRNIADIVGDDGSYRHFVRRIHKEFEIADEERNTHVYVFYQKNRQRKEIGFAVIGHSDAKMRVWEKVLKEEEWVGQDFKMARPCYELMYMYIRPEERKRGWGSKLFDRVVTFTRQGGIKAIYAYVGERSPEALIFYKQKGGAVIGDLSGEGSSNAFFEWRV